MSLALRLARNECGRDFLIGDIHGEFDRVEQLLTQVKFDCQADRLVSVGDLVDRGPDSDQVLEWLARPGLYSVMGNHELMALAHACGGPLHAFEHVQNGGAWLAQLTPAIQMEYAEAFAKLPLAIELQTARGAIGIVHADVPPGLGWPELMAQLDREDRDLANWLLWSRKRIDAHARGETVTNVPGIERVYVGHTPVKAPMDIGNVTFIDTGACFGGPMVLIDAATGAEAARA